MRPYHCRRCPICGDRLYWHRLDNKWRCNCLPAADDPVGEELELRKLEARLMARAATGRAPVNEATFAAVAAERRGWYD